MIKKKETFMEDNEIFYIENETAHKIFIEGDFFDKQKDIISEKLIVLVLYHSLLEMVIGLIPLKMEQVVRLNSLI